MKPFSASRALLADIREWVHEPWTDRTPDPLSENLHEFLQTPELSAEARTEQAPDLLLAASYSAAANCCITGALLNSALHMETQLSTGENVWEWCVQRLDMILLPALREPERAQLQARLGTRKEHLEQLNHLSLLLVSLAHGLRLRRFWTLGKGYLAEAKQQARDELHKVETSICDGILTWAGRLCKQFAEAGLHHVFPSGGDEITSDIFSWLTPAQRLRELCSSYCWWRGLLLESEELPTVDEANDRVYRLLCEYMKAGAPLATTSAESPSTCEHPDGPGDDCHVWYQKNVADLEPAQHELLKYLWQAGKEPKPRVPVREVVLHLWPDEEKSRDPIRALAVRLSRLRENLLRLGVPWTYKMTRGGWNAELIRTPLVGRG
jgi:hypothetical protein